LQSTVGFARRALKRIVAHFASPWIEDADRSALDEVSYALEKRDNAVYVGAMARDESIPPATPVATPKHKWEQYRTIARGLGWCDR
jgi:hypothetical protein